MTLKEALDLIRPLDREAEKAALSRQDSLIKPLGSLGKLEDIAIRVAGITGEVYKRLPKKCIVVMCADNGVCEEGVSACPQSVTRTQAVNFTLGRSGINVLSRQAGSELRIVDIGIADNLAFPGIMNRKIAAGTRNMSREPAMSREQAVRALETGIQIVEKLASEGFDLVGTGEMGIGNTSTASAILMCFTGLPAETVVGRGAGLTMESHRSKMRVIERSLSVNRPDPSDPLDVLSKVGGFDIAGMAGCFIACAALRIPVVVDGFISAVAALLACRMHPGVKDFLIPSHASAEPGYMHAMDAMGLSPSLLLDMRLGEGTGCALMFPVIDAALAIACEMYTFEEGDIVNDFMVDIRPPSRKAED
jgi:nicotinate-nucleotide--dimethylbenzimidazole phosphoribosyltransferase